MVGNVEFIVVNRHSFVQAALHELLRKPRGDQNDPFSSARGDRLTAPATKWAHLLRLTRYPRPYPLFMKNRRRSTCSFYFALLAMVEGGGLNVVDGPISWQTGHAAALARPKWSVFLRPRELKGCYGYGAISKLCRFTGLKSGPSSIPSFFGKRQAIYLRFCFCGFLYGRRFAIQPRKPA